MKNKFLHKNRCALFDVTVQVREQLPTHVEIAAINSTIMSVGDREQWLFHQMIENFKHYKFFPSCNLFWLNVLSCIRTAATAVVATLRYGKIRYANPNDDFSNGIRETFYWRIEINTKLIATTSLTTQNAYNTTKKRAK